VTWRAKSVAALVVLVVWNAPTVLGGVDLTETESHCVVAVVAHKTSGEFILSEPRCFSSLAQALTDASGDSSAFPADFSGSELLSGEGGSALLATLGVHFEGANGSGSSISVTGGACSGGYWNTGLSWANRISSSWNGCYRLRHYDNPHLGGSSAPTVGAGSTHNLPGAMDNKTESVAYLSS
jgi:hypothetical protein